MAQPKNQLIRLLASVVILSPSRQNVLWYLKLGQTASFYTLFYSLFSNYPVILCYTTRATEITNKPQIHTEK